MSSLGLQGELICIFVLLCFLILYDILTSMYNLNLLLQFQNRKITLTAVCTLATILIINFVIFHIIMKGCIQKILH
jgi:hypothetical protein